MCIYRATDDAAAHLTLAQDTGLPIGLRVWHWQVYEGLCWLEYLKSTPIPILAERMLTGDERFALFKAREIRKK